MNAVNYIQNNIDNIIHILNINNFLEYGYGLTSKGIVAMHIQELHPLVLGDMYEKYNGFTDFSAKELTGILVVLQIYLFHKI